MRGKNEDESDGSEGGHRVKIAVVGTLVSLLAGAVLFFVIFTVRYGQTPFGHMFGGGRNENREAGKLAYDKSSKVFLGIIRSEGHSVERGADVFYIERAGGSLIEVRKDRVEVREPNK